MKIKFISIVLCCLSSLVFAKTDKPNIIYINADDLGVMDVGFMGNSVFHTPHLDKLASEGMIFTQAYAPAANCAPSRAACLSGQYASRTGVYTVGTSERGQAATRKLIPIKNTLHLSDDNPTIGDALQAAGYTTCSIGKWHVGKDPTKQGFDINIGGTTSGSPPGSYFGPFPLPNIKNGPKGEYLTDRLTDEAIQFVDAHKEENFFIYLTYYAVHTPLQGRLDLLKKYQGRKDLNPDYAAMVEGLDENVGRLIKHLDELGLTENTMILFTSDNGGIRSVAKQDPYRAGKGSYYEGGIREPMFVRWPAKVKAGSSCDVPVTGLDFFPTLVAVAEGEIPKGKLLDGKNILPLILQEGEIEKRSLFWHFPIYLQAYAGEGDDARDALFRTRPGSVIRKGNWKLHHYFEDDGYELYDLVKDIGERNNLAEKHPEKLAELKAALNDWRKASDSPIPTKLNPKYDAVKEAELLTKEKKVIRKKKKKKKK